MNQMRNRRGGRAGFTLIELLVVIAIIAVLVGLLAPAVMRAFARAPEAQARADIDQMATAIGTFKTDFGVTDNIPSLFVLHENMANYNMGNADEARSRAFLTKVFGRRLQGQIDWNADGAISNAPFVLSGEQALVFFLGGAQTSAPTRACVGFSSSPLDPIHGSGSRKGPYFDFKANRLRPGPNNFFVYVDPFHNGLPYVYFAPRTSNDYFPDSQVPDFRGAPNMVAPFRVAPGGRFVNPTGFQIICAGVDNQFGNSATWSASGGYGSGPGEDDLSNFSLRRLGFPQE